MYDLIVIGAGALGTFHAYHAAKAGLRVLLLEKDNYPVGATVRNFGQVEDLGYHTQDFINELMLAEARRIVSFPITIKKTWAGFYSQTKAEIFEYDVDEHIRIVTGIGGKGMSSGAGYAEDSVRQWLGVKV
ncbi:FAD-dependent oxidoreductase [Spirosoma fluminis]